MLEQRVGSPGAAMEWPTTDRAGSRFQRPPPTISPNPELKALEATLDCGELAQGLWEMLVVKLTFWSPQKVASTQSRHFHEVELSGGWVANTNPGSRKEEAIKSAHLFTER